VRLPSYLPADIVHLVAQLLVIPQVQPHAMMQS